MCCCHPPVTAQTTDHHAIRNLLRAPAPAALGARRRAPPSEGRAGAGGAGRPAWHRLPLACRAPLPRGVQPLLGAGGVPGGGQPTDQPGPAGPRDRAAPAGLQPPGAGRRADRHPGPALRRAGGVRPRWEEALEFVTRMLVEEPFAGHQGKFVDVPPRNVVPKPLQRPHPPLWVACSRRETIHLAATKGIGALWFSFIEPPRAKEWVDDYYATIASEACVPAGFALNSQVACVLPLMCHEDEETAIDRGLDGAHFFGYALAHYYVFGTHRPGVTNIWEEFQANRSSFGFDRQIAAQTGVELGAQLLQEGLGSLRGAIGTPAQIRDLIRGYQAAGVDQLVFVSQAGRTRHEHICESLELFAA